MGSEPVRDLRLLALKLVCNLARDERDASREGGLRRPSRDQVLDAQLDRVARVGMREDGACVRVCMVGDVIRAADCEVHDG